MATNSTGKLSWARSVTTNQRKLRRLHSLACSVPCLPSNTRLTQQNCAIHSLMLNILCLYVNFTQNSVKSNHLFNSFKTRSKIVNNEIYLCYRNVDILVRGRKRPNLKKMQLCRMTYRPTDTFINFDNGVSSVKHEQ